MRNNIPKNIKRLLAVFYISLGILLLAELFIHKHGHTHFEWENWHGFYAVFGFVAFVLLVLAAKYILRPLVKRREDYYER